MNARTIRRAQERRAAKQARKAAVSEAQLIANRANAQLSTGPISEPGKKTSSLNAVKTGLTGRTVLLHSDDAEAYRRHIAAYEAEYKPVGVRECELVQSLADTQWRLNRIPGLESGIYALGRAEFEGVVEDEMVELHSHLKYEKQLRNLQLQESRLMRRYQKEMAELRALQKGGADDREASSASTLASKTEPRASASGHSIELASNFQTEPRVLTSGISESTPAPNLQLTAPLPTPHIDSFALPSSPWGNF